MKWITAILLLFVPFASAAQGQCPAPGSVVELFGTIGKDLGISMKLTAQKDLLSGTYFYVKYEQFAVEKDTDPDGEAVYVPRLKHAKRIALHGTCVGGALTLQESDAAGKATGSFRGSFTKTQIVEGTWSTPDGKMGLPFHLQALLPTDHVSGKYTSDGYPGELDILLLDAGQGQLQIQGSACWVNEITGSVHDGEVEGTVKLQGDKAEYADTDSGCRFTMQFSKGTVTVTDDNNQCGGANVTFNGTYQRVGPPTFAASDQTN